MKQVLTDKRFTFSQKFLSRIFLPSIAFLLLACPKKDDKVSLPSEQPSSQAGNGQSSVTQQDTANKSPEQDASPTNTPGSAASEGAEKAATAQSASATAGTEASGAADKAQTKPLGDSPSIRVSGQVIAKQQGQASFKVPGHLLRTFVKVGERVKRGQVLAQLESADFELRQKAAANQVELSKVTLEQAKRDLERETQLRKEGATTATNFERVSNQLASSQIALNSAQIALAQAQKAVGDTRLLASFDGVISRVFKAEGEYVGVGAAVFEVASLNDLEVSLKVPEFLLSTVKLGLDVKISIPSARKEVNVTISRVVPVIQENTRTFEVIGKFKESDWATGIVPGQFVEGAFLN